MKNNKPRITLAREYIEKHYKIRYNVISNRFEYLKEGTTVWSELNENDILVDLLEHHFNISNAVLMALLKSDFVKKYNPFTDYFQNLSNWNGTDYINLLSEYIEVSEKDMLRFKTQFKKMFVRVVACSLEVSLNKQAFVLVHKTQNSGKSTFLRWLCPPKLSNYYIEDIGNDKDSLIALAENFIINLDELSTLSKKDINVLKSIMSKDKVKTRLPYDARTSVLNRRCSFVGSTNNEEFLSDDTGNVRWVCFEINRINWNYKKDFDIDKIWSQAYSLFKDSFDYQLSANEIEENEKANVSFLIRTPEMELLQQSYYPSTKNYPGSEFLTATELMDELSKRAPGIRLYSNSMGKALNILGFKRTSEYNKDLKFSIKGYYVLSKDKEELINVFNDVAEQKKIATEKEIQF